MLFMVVVDEDFLGVCWLGISFGKGSVAAMSKYRYTANDIHLV